MFSWIQNLYNYFTEIPNESCQKDKNRREREKNIRESLEIGDFNKDLIDKIVNLKKSTP